MIKRVIFSFLVLLAWQVANVASAAPQFVADLIFTEIAGVELTGSSGSGTSADPVILYETIDGFDASIRISGLTDLIDPLFLQKVVTNDTSESWSSFDLELQTIFGTPSTDGDGLSFAQGNASVRPFTSDVFVDVDEITDVRDFINFSNPVPGPVAPGETVTFNFAITHFGSIDPVFLRQRPNFIPGSPVPEPTTLLIMGIGLLGMAGFRRIQKPLTSLSSRKRP